MVGVYSDYIVVGSGAGGAAAAWRLAQSGRRVLVLEKGRKLPTDGSTLDVTRVLRRKAFVSEEIWNTGGGRTIVPREYFNLGGKTKWSGGALVRFQRHEFGSDPGHRCRPWPIGFDDLEPYYARAESLLGVRSFDLEPDSRRILDELFRRDPAWSWDQLPLGLAPGILEHDAELRRFDGGFASPAGLKSDAEVCLLDQLRGASHVSIVADKEVVALEPADGDPKRVAAVGCSDGSRYHGAMVLLAAGALHSPRLLQGYLRRSGLPAVDAQAEQIGRNYKHHLNASMLAVSRRRMSDRVRKTVVLFHPDCPHSSVQPVGPVDGDALSARLPGFVPRGAARAVAARAYGFWLSTEDGSAPENRVISADGTGCPTLDYDVSRLPEARAEHERLCRMMRHQLQRLGFLTVARTNSVEQTAYACGTLAAGDRPETSVVAADGRVHALDNVYVVDGSALPRAGRVNPALTIYAWGLRVADLLARRCP